MWTLNNKTIVITGATNGIGRACRNRVGKKKS